VVVSPVVRHVLSYPGFVLVRKKGTSTKLSLHPVPHGCLGEPLGLFFWFVPYCIIQYAACSNPGYLWNLQVKLQPIVNLLPDKGRLMDFLLQRKECKMVILSVCSQSTLIPSPRFWF
jgi:hypothetical protein